MGPSNNTGQYAKKVVCDDPGLVDFAVSLVDSVSYLYLHNGQVKFLGKCFEEIQTTVLSTVRENGFQSQFIIQL